MANVAQMEKRLEALEGSIETPDISGLLAEINALKARVVALEDLAHGHKEDEE